MSTTRLSTTSFVVLGLIGLRGPSTPYDLKRAVEHSVGYFWPFPHAQLYDEPARLAAAGLLSVSSEETGRRRKTYSMTGDGMAELRSWLGEPAGETFQLRNVAELKLFFGELASEEDLKELAREQIAVHERRLTELADVSDRFEGRTDLTARLVPLQLGQRLEQAALDFWRERLEGPVGPETEAEA